MSARRQRLVMFLCVFGLVLATIVVYWPGLHGGFIFDDYPNLVADSDWKVTSLDLAQWQRAVSHGFAGLGGRPLAMLSFAVNHYFTGLDTFWLKLTNLLFHLLNGALVLLLCRGLFSGAPRVSGEVRLGTFAALVITAAWMLHPLQVSSVLYVVQRMELGAQTGVLVALIAYLAGRKRQIAGGTAWPWFGLSCAGTALGLAFKETALLVPGYALLIEVFILRFNGARGTRSTGWIALYSIAGVLAVAVFATVLAPHFVDSSAYEARNFNWSERLWTQLPVLAMYLKQIAWPLPDTLLFYYDQFPVSTGLFSPPTTAQSAVLLVALFGAAAASWRRWPLVPFGIGWFLVAHALTSNVVPLELAFEHRNYLALLGILIALAQPFSWLCRNRDADARVTFAVLPIVGLAVLCMIQSATWGDPMRLATALASRNPESPRASYELGRLLLEQAGSRTDSPQWSLARKEFEHSAQLDNSSPLAEQALIMMGARTEQPIPVRTWHSLRTKLSRVAAGPQEIGSLYALSDCRIQRLCKFDDQQLFDTFVVALERNPNSATLHVMYGNFAWNIARDPELAIAMQREAVNLRPGSIRYKAGLAKFLLASSVAANHLEAQLLIQMVRAANGDGRFDADLAALASLQTDTSTDTPSINGN